MNHPARRERNAFGTSDLGNVCAELLVDLFVFAFAEEVTIQFGYCWWKIVRGKRFWRGYFCCVWFWRSRLSAAFYGALGWCFCH